jgi:L-lactate dehydrogenase complex protein LldG
VIERFLLAAARSDYTAVSVPDIAGARQAVAAIVAEHGASGLAWWEGDPLVAALEPAAIAPTAAAEVAGAGLTSAECATADTGTLLMTYGPGRSRRTGLLPDLHICLLRADAIVEGLEQAVARVHAGTQPPAALTMVTGPSASSDIEKIRVEGVHGPRALHAIVIASP